MTTTSPLGHGRCGVSRLPPGLLTIDAVVQNRKKESTSMAIFDRFSFIIVASGAGLCGIAIALSPNVTAAPYMTGGSYDCAQPSAAASAAPAAAAAAPAAAGAPAAAAAAAAPAAAGCAAPLADMAGVPMALPGPVPGGSAGGAAAGFAPSPSGSAAAGGPDRAGRRAVGGCTRPARRGRSGRRHVGPLRQGPADRTGTGGCASSGSAPHPRSVGQLAATSATRRNRKLCAGQLRVGSPCS